MRARERLRSRGYEGVQRWEAGIEGPWQGLASPQARLRRWFPDLQLRPCAQLLLRGRPHLVYACGSELLIGGPPEPAPALSEEWELLGWRVPRALAAFYAVHDGLASADGPRAQGRRDGILAAEALFPLTHRMRFGEENILYAPGDLLLFSPDGRGGGYCFHRDHPEEPDPPVRHWDGGTRALGPLQRFEEVCAGLQARWGRSPGPQDRR